MMRGMFAVIVATLLTAVCWGVYGPVLLNGQLAMQNSRLRPFIGVGIAYFIIAVAAPVVLLRIRGEKGSWTSSGLAWSLFAGALGALGALGIILAFSFKGKPLFVMPLVFVLAPVVNAFVTMFLARTMRQAGPLFLAGLILVMIGAVTVLAAKPAHQTAKVSVDKESGRITVEREVVDKATGEKQTVKVSDDSEEKLEQTDKAAFEAYKTFKNSKMSWTDFIAATLFICMTAICWGAYGPALHKGQVAMLGSRLRPLICVGLAYFLIGVLVPLPLLSALEPNASFNLTGMLWSLGGGAAGALGALGIIMAFTYGGKPVYVMPLVFGCAPVVNSFTEIIGKSMYNEIGPLFYAGLIIVMVGAVVVLVFAPKGAPHAPAATPVPNPL